MATGVLCVLLPLALILWSALDTWIIQPARARRVLARWAETHSIALQEAQLRRWRLGPNPGAFFDSRIVFRIVVIDPEGRTRRGWALSGYRVLGAFGARVDVVWDEPGAAGIP